MKIQTPPLWRLGTHWRDHKGNLWLCGYDSHLLFGKIDGWSRIRVTARSRKTKGAIRLTWKRDEDGDDCALHGDDGCEWPLYSNPRERLKKTLGLRRRVIWVSIEIL